MGIWVIKCSKDPRQLPNQTEASILHRQLIARGVLRMAMTQHPQDTDIANLIALLMPTAFITKARCSPGLLHEHNHWSGRQHIPEFEGHQTKFSSQLRLCVAWVSQSIPDLSFPVCDFGYSCPYQAPLLPFAQGLNRMKSTQETSPLFKSICSGL